MRIAHRFIGGKRSEQPLSPVGTTESEEGVNRPSGTNGYAALIVPALKMLGYHRRSLRD